MPHTLPFVCSCALIAHTRGDCTHIGAGAVSGRARFRELEDDGRKKRRTCARPLTWGWGVGYPVCTLLLADGIGKKVYS